MEGRIGLHDDITLNRVRREMADLALMANHLSFGEWLVEMQQLDEDVLRTRSD